MRNRLRNAIIGLIAIAILGIAQASVPFWGAKESSSADTPPAALKPGEWIWGGDSKAMGPMVALVSLTEQRAYIYRNGLLVAVTTISTGKPGYETPTGVFTILQKDKDHRSNKYNDAPMPYQERLTWDGIALHAGGLPGYPESHGCIHLPTEFARRLFDATSLGMTVVVAEEGMSHSDMVHPGLLSPIVPETGEMAPIPMLEPGVPFRWTPERSPDGPVSIVLSRTDALMVVLRNGVEIGRARVQVRTPGLVVGTRAYVMGSGFMAGEFPQFPGGRAPQWMEVAVPGHEADQGRAVDRDAINNVAVPPDFLDQLFPLLQPGAVVVATDAPILPSGPAASRSVLDDSPPGS